MIFFSFLYTYFVKCCRLLQENFIYMILLFFLGCSTDQSLLINPWETIKHPTQGPSQAIGSPQAGCLMGAKSLTPDGTNFQVMRIARQRFFAHSSMIEYLEKLATEMHHNKLPPLLIGDLSYARGGPFTSGHQSHQNGLDADLWYDAHHDELVNGQKKKERNPAQIFNLYQRESVPARKIVSFEWKTQPVEKNNQAEQEQKSPLFSLNSLPLQQKEQIFHSLILAAQYREVDRIFVHPAVKKELCMHQKYQAANFNHILAKIRPWWGHDDHFHVRLKCPVNSPLCQNTAALPPGNGCDASLDWWFTSEAELYPQSRPSALKEQEKNSWFWWRKKKVTKKLPQLPAACYSLTEIQLSL